MRIFNRYYSSYDLLLLLGDVLISFFSTVAVRAFMVLSAQSSGDQWRLWIIQGVVMALIVMISFYYVNLYSLDQILSIRELLLRFMNGFGVACIVIGIVSYPIPELGFRTIYFSEMALMGFSLCLWRLGFVRALRQQRSSVKVLIVGLQSIGRLVA